MKSFLLILAMISGFAQAQTSQLIFNHKPIVDRFEKDMDNRLRMAQDADVALGKIVVLASEILKAEADKADERADRLQRRGRLWDAMHEREKAIKLRNAGEDFELEWRQDYKGLIPSLVALSSGYFSRETPELYTPMSTWLRDWYHTIKDLLGERLCVTLHLDDLQVINEGTPVVLRLKSMGDIVPTESVYGQYFNPWTACVSYWLVYIGCEVACAGMDISLVCSPIAMIAEETVFKFVAPRWSDRFYARIYQ